MTRVLCLFILSCFFADIAASRGADFTWCSGWGWLPDQLGSGPTLRDSSQPETPVLTNLVLVLANDKTSEYMNYVLSGPSLGTMPSALVLEAELQVVSERTGDPAEAVTGIAFVTAPFVGNVLWIGNGRVFLGGGASHPAVRTPTTNAFHTYRIEVTGTVEGSPVMVFQDGALLLRGELFRSNQRSNPPPNGGQLRPSRWDLGADPLVGFGNLSLYACGETRWRSFSVGAVTNPPVLRPLLTMPDPATLVLQGVVGKTYQILTAGEMASEGWKEFASVTLRTNASASFTIASEKPSKLFRAVTSAGLPRYVYPSGANDTFAFSNALATLSSGDTLVVAPGEYTLDLCEQTNTTPYVWDVPWRSWLNFENVTDLNLLGYGAKLFFPRAKGYGITFNSVTNVTIRGLEFRSVLDRSNWPSMAEGDGWGLMGAMAGSGTNLCRSVTIEDCSFIDWIDQAITTTAGSDAMVQGLTVRNCRFSRIGTEDSPTGYPDGTCVSGLSAGDLLLEGCVADQVWNGLFEHGYGGIEHPGVTFSGAIIRSNIMTAVGHAGIIFGGISTNGGSYSDVLVEGNQFLYDTNVLWQECPGPVWKVCGGSNFVFRNNIIRRQRPWYTAAIMVGGGEAQVDDVRIENNFIEAEGWGIRAGIGYTNCPQTYHVTIAGNYFQGCWVPVVLGCNDAAVVNNRFTNIGSSVIAALDGFSPDWMLFGASKAGYIAANTVLDSPNRSADARFIWNLGACTTNNAGCLSVDWWLVDNVDYNLELGQQQLCNYARPEDFVFYTGQDATNAPFIRLKTCLGVGGYGGCTNSLWAAPGSVVEAGDGKTYRHDDSWSWTGWNQTY